MWIIRILVAFIIVFAAAAIGSIATTQNIPTWYAGLDKPSFNPPNMVFGPVWTILYSFIAISLYLVWSKHPKDHRMYWWFGAQMVLNTLWSLVFFGAHQLWLAVVVILALIITIAGTIRTFWPVSKPAAYLLVPYIGWVGFATVLTISIALLNP